MSDDDIDQRFLKRESSLNLPDWLQAIESSVGRFKKGENDPIRLFLLRNSLTVEFIFLRDECRQRINDGQLEHVEKMIETMGDIFEVGVFDDEVFLKQKPQRQEEYDNMKKLFSGASQQHAAEQDKVKATPSPRPSTLNSEHTPFEEQLAKVERSASKQRPKA